jgi:hypothetical protein
MVLTLASHRSRHEVVQRFTREAPGCLAQLEIDSYARRDPARDRQKTWEWCQPSPSYDPEEIRSRYQKLLRFTQTRAALGVWPPLVAESDQHLDWREHDHRLTVPQLEIVRAALPFMQRRWLAYHDAIADLDARRGEKEHQLEEMSKHEEEGSDVGSSCEHQHPGETPEDLNSAIDELALLAGELRVAGASLPSPFGAPRPGEGGQIRTEYLKKQLARSVAATREGLPGLAAADQLIKGLMTAVEDDLEAQIMRPRLNAIRKHARDRGIELGIVQRTSILAANRRPARVSPKATIEFDFPEEPDLLQQLQSLTRLAAAVPTTGAAFGSAPGVALTALGSQALGAQGDGWVDLVEQLALEPTEHIPRIYKVETGADLNLVPIVLPDGQSVGFDLNYALTTPVREPEAREGRRLGKVDRHFIETHVQDTSFELRELSRFETQTKLAEPTRRSGGIPLINQVPILKDIPLIGYTKVRKGSAAGLQESLIFVHSVTYPTVADMMALLN